MLNSQQSSRFPMFAVGLVLLLCTFAFYVVTVRAGHTGDARLLFHSAKMAWTLSLVSILASGVFFALRRQKRFILLIFLSVLMLLVAQYIRDGGETTPLPYPSDHGTR
jgi:hypothetical protein